MHNFKNSFLIYFLACLSIILLSLSQTWADTYVSGNITTDTTWTKANSPYIVTGTVQVYPGATLTIEPGGTIKFNRGTGLVIGHKLIAIGTEQNIINFTSNAETPGFEDWTGINFTDSSVDAIFDDNGNYLDGSIIKYCNIEHSNGIRIDSSSPYISLNKTQYNSGCPHGECCHGTISLNNSNSIIEHNEITNGEGRGGAAICCSYSSPLIFNNLIHNNKGLTLIDLAHCNSIIKNNELINNPRNYDSLGTPIGNSDGIAIYDSTAEIKGNLISGNGGNSLFMETWSNINAMWNELIPDELFSSVLINTIYPINVSLHNNNLFSIWLVYPFDIDAANNYWGTLDTSLIDANITDYYDDLTLGKVNYQPITTSAYKKVDFSADPLYGSFPLQVTFNNNSMGIINSVTWDFGDGETSNEITPIHVYKSTGTFNVILTVIGRNGEITETKSNYITVDTPNYTLSLSKSGNGSVKVNGTTHTLPWSGQFPSGANVQLEAVADSGWSFTNWTGDYTGSTNPTTLNVNGNKNISANFNQNCNYSLTININPPGSGTVTKNPDKANYCPNEQVILTANPSASYNFSSWSGVNSSNGVTAQVTMSSNKTVTANFSQMNYTLSLSKTGNGSVKVNGTAHALPWSGQFPSGTEVQVEAVADNGWNFSSWSGDFAGSTNPITITISANKNTIVNFSQSCVYSLNININPPSSGNVIRNPDKANYCPNEQVSLTANPTTGYNFTSWSGVDSSSGMTAQVTMSSNKTVTANFTQIPVVNYTLSITKASNGSVKVDGTTHTLPWSGEFSSGTNVQIEAVPDSGWSFTNWTGDYTGSANPTTINISGNKNITANFSQNCDRSLTVNINPPSSGNVTKNPDKANYCTNEQVTLTASPNSGYTFSSWDGVDSNIETTASITMNANRTVTANFSQQASNEPDIYANPLAQEFGNIPVGDSSMPQTLTISNTGSGNLIIGTLSITGTDASQFIKQNDNCSGQTLTPSANCTVKVIFSPTSTGSFDSILNIPSNDLDEINVMVNLKGGSGADITGSWISLFQQCNGAKCKINGKVNVQNIGNGDALSSLVKFYLSDDDVYHEGDSFLKEAKTGTLKVGKTKSISLSYSFPSGVSATDKYIIAVIDAGNTVVESDESNNIIVYGPILRANLTGTWISLTQQCKGVKCKIRGALNIQNIGYQDAASLVTFYLSDDSTYDEGDMFLKQTSTGTLKVGKSKKMSLSYSFLSGVSASGKYIIAVIDADNSVLEANEGDNNIIYGPLP